MKRIFSLFAAMLFAAIVLVPPFARADGGKVVFSMNSVDNVATGESFTVTLSISGEYQAHGMNLSIEFDPNSMTLESCDQGAYLDALRGKGALVVLDSVKLAPEGKIKLGVIMPTDPATGSGDVLIMKFHVNDGVTVNQQVIMVIHEFINLPLGQMHGTDIPFSTQNSIITLNGGATPEAGYNEGDDGVGNNIPSSPSQPPEPTPGGSNTPSPFSTVSPAATPEPGTTPVSGTAGETAEPGTTPQAASESAQPYAAITASPDGTVTASPVDQPAPVDTTEQPGGEGIAEAETEKPAGESERKGGEAKKSSPLPYIIAGAAGVAAAASAILVISKKKRG